MTMETEIAKVREIAEKSQLRHIAFIMDGNGRWATRKGLPREAGHKAGAETFRRVVRLCGDIGIDTVTVYAFSTENWRRPTVEVNAIMKLLEAYIRTAEEEDEENRTSYLFLGDKSALAPSLAKKCTELEEFTARYHRRLNIALNYGGRAEIVNACNKLIAQGKTCVTEDDISAALYTAHQNDPDLIVRTAGEYRLSNFLMWQSAYSELYFTDTLWPDYSFADLAEAVEAFARRTRRFGAVVQ